MPYVLVTEPHLNELTWDLTGLTFTADSHTVLHSACLLMPTMQLCLLQVVTVSHVVASNATERALLLQELTGRSVKAWFLRGWRWKRGAMEQKGMKNLSAFGVIIFRCHGSPT